MKIDQCPQITEIAQWDQRVKALKTTISAYRIS